jgi:UDP-glucose 4-epimerase
MSKKILVTGGAGYIGSKIVADLIKKKKDVYIIDNLSTGHKSLIHKKALFLHGNIGEKKKIRKFIRLNKIKSIIHCAASLDIAEGEKNPKKYFINNYINTKKLLEVCVENSLENFIFSSTCAVYGNVFGEISEMQKPKPISNYGKTKLMCEEIIKKFSKKFNFNYGILRYFNVAGSDVKNKIGCINKNDQLIKNLSSSIVNNYNKIFIYGNDYDTKDGTCIRDYIHLSDLSEIHCKLLKIISKENKSYIMNCGYGFGFSVLEIIKKFEIICGVNLKKIFLPRRKGDVEEIFANPKKINKILNLKSNNKYKLNDIIKSSIAWEKFLNEK